MNRVVIGLAGCLPARDTVSLPRMFPSNLVSPDALAENVLARGIRNTFDAS